MTKQILLGLAGAVFFGAWLQLFVAPQRKVSADVTKQVRTLRQNCAETRKKLTQMPQMEQQLKQLLSQHEAVVVPAAPEEQLPEMLDSIAQMAKAFQVRLVSIKPKADLSQLAPGPSGYVELPVEVQSSAGYHQIGAFLDALEHSESFVRLQEFKIQADPKDHWHHQASLILQVYLFPGRERSRSS